MLSTAGDHEEEWRPVVGYEGLYEVSSLGRVKSRERVILRAGVSYRLKQKDLKTFLGKRGYLSLVLRGSEKPVTKSVHRLVCEAFHGPAPEGKPLVLHGNDVKTDNRVDNLRWGNHSDNMYDAVRNGIHRGSQKTHCVRGHDFDSSDAYLDKAGHRKCRACQRERRADATPIPPGHSWHGTLRGYQEGKCRCEPCRETRRDLYKRKKY